MIQYENQTECFVIIVRRGNQLKYIERNFFDKKHINCTIKINKALRFNTEKYANEFWDKWNNYDSDLEFIEIRQMKVRYELP